MLVRLGERRSAPGLVEALVECHERIRRFTRFAAQLAAVRPGEEEVRSVAAQIGRYFRESFPLHVADEEEQLVPKLSGTSDDVDRALAQMHAEHVEHAGEIAHLVALCTELERSPARLGELAGELAACADRLAAGIEPHLALEERVIFPALARLPAGERDAILTALRERRERALS